MKTRRGSEAKGEGAPGPGQAGRSPATLYPLGFLVAFMFFSSLCSGSEGRALDSFAHCLALSCLCSHVPADTLP